ncbi:MAG: tRNA 4-thiouridine(8) synthase ThiI [Clostridia bacterium]|nr:tRNA 4-thiouridine(8) synthase ThiI [Clostridia bacterium]MBR2176964.1 tRNA 4-thiouridine(8) synthase ThiI [Clostridia bacterium]
MKEVILIKLGEIVLKGLNRKNFEDTLIKSIKRRLHKIGAFKVKASQSIITVAPVFDDIDMDEAVECVSKIFGIAAFSRACTAEKDIEKIKEAAGEYLEEQFSVTGSFKVEAKRSDKKFPLTSPEIAREVGGYLAERFPDVRVDVHNPDTVVTVEIRDGAAYIHSGVIRGAGGIPVGTGGKAAILISGGIDSPVAAYMMAKRGIELTAVHFASPPYTSERAEEKVTELLKRVSAYSGRITMYTVPFTKLQEQIRDKCHEEYFTIIMRRFMMTIAEEIARKNDCQALITGESLGQVASQTIGAIACTDDACTMPVFRPLIGMDKEEIIEISRKIDTFEISIQPYEDCCTVFTPKHPRTRPVLKNVIEEQNKIDFGQLVKEAVENVRIMEIS